MTESVLVRYVGSKDKKTDNVAGTDAVWNANGDIQEVSVETWEKLKAHPDIWQLQERPTDIEYALSKAHSDALRREEASVSKVGLALSERFARMTDEEVRAYAKETAQNIKLAPALKGENLRTRVLEALKG